jgi:hypothetical protein
MEALIFVALVQHIAYWRSAMILNILIAGVMSTAAGVGFSPDVNNPAYWDRAAVVYAEITKVSLESVATYKIQIHPIATLTGDFDSAYHDDLSAYASFGNVMVSDRQKPPQEGTKAIVIFDWGTEKYSDQYWITDRGASFMPIDKRGMRPSICEVTGFDDPKVTETIENLRKLRGRQREETERKAAAEKKGK